VQVGGIVVAVEHKSKQALPGRLTDAVQQATRNAPGWHAARSAPARSAPDRGSREGQRHRLAVVRLEDLPALLAVALPFLCSTYVGPLDSGAAPLFWFEPGPT